MASSVEYRQPTPPVAKDSGPGTGIYIAFVPWVLFTLVTDHGTLIAGSVVALVAAVAITVPSLLKGHRYAPRKRDLQLARSGPVGHVEREAHRSSDERRQGRVTR